MGATMTANNPDRPYAFRGEAGFDRVMRQRQANVEAAFVLPLLEPGVNVVDFGCGQGTITAGLAEAVAPGAVLGFDTQEEPIKRAAEMAADR
jgi:2-polyprenyl-3-methyl-5-hydroxy-6-metoxy-1,4-benzoquinol methylase